MRAVIRLQDGHALDHQEIYDLFEGALAFSVFNNVYMDGVEEELRKMMGDPNFGIFVGIEDGHAKCLSVIVLPQDKLITVPQCTMFFNSGSKALREEVIKTSLDFCRQNGHIRLWAVNGSRHSDAAWQKVFNSAGPTGKIATFHEYEFGE